MFRDKSLEKKNIDMGSVQDVNSQSGALFNTPRSSNLELYRIVCMLMIVGGHYVCNGGLFGESGPLTKDFYSGNSLYLSLSGFWGKTGINCFMMITGYFMCTSKITLRKFVKLMGQIYFYKLLIYTIFLITGYETLSFTRIFKLAMPFWGISDGFISCFIVFWLTIPFWSILIQNMNKRQHELLLLISIGIYTLLGSIPTFRITYNYVTWFGVLFLIASYIRLYPHPLFEKRTVWGWMTFLSILAAMASVWVLRRVFNQPGYFFLIDSNKIFAVAVAVFSFLWFKNMNLGHNKVINGFGAGTFGVLLIHANSEAMRSWLWYDIVNVIGHYSMPLVSLILYHIGVTLTIYIVCNLIDQIRIATIEKWFLYLYDNKCKTKVENFISKIIY